MLSRDKIVRSWRAALAIGAALGGSVARETAALGDLPTDHEEVQGNDVPAAEMRVAGAQWKSVAWGALRNATLEPADYELRLRVVAWGLNRALAIPVCAGRGEVTVDGRRVEGDAGPLVVLLSEGPHELLIPVRVSAYERRIACGSTPRLGSATRKREGLSAFHFESPEAGRGGGQAVVFVPYGHDARKPGPLLVGLHPWNGSIWTYAAYAEMLEAAQARDVPLILPSALGNSLYTEAAEAEVLRAIAAFAGAVAVDARAVSLWGASMGGAGALTIGLHHPDRFASITSFFGDSKYDLHTYVRAILRDEAAAHRISALDFVDNARNLPVWLVHGRDDRTCPVAQSEMFARAMQQRGYGVRFDRVAGVGHAGALVSRFLPELVALASAARVADPVGHVTYRSVRPDDVGAYGIRIERSSLSGDALIDIEMQSDAVDVRRAEGVQAIWLSPGALGTAPDRAVPLRLEPGVPAHVRLGWAR
jgi:pimeloyl-ACP methyl ester carboxylesterase